MSLRVPTLLHKFFPGRSAHVEKQTVSELKKFIMMCIRTHKRQEGQICVPAIIEIGKTGCDEITVDKVVEYLHKRKYTVTKEILERTYVLNISWK
jgi:hypothetical protein